MCIKREQHYSLLVTVSLKGSSHRPDCSIGRFPCVGASCKWKHTRYILLDWFFYTALYLWVVTGLAASKTVYGLSWTVIVTFILGCYEKIVIWKLWTLRKVLGILFAVPALQRILFWWCTGASFLRLPVLLDVVYLLSCWCVLLHRYSGSWSCSGFPLHWIDRKLSVKSVATSRKCLCVRVCDFVH